MRTVRWQTVTPLSGMPPVAAFARSSHTAAAARASANDAIKRLLGLAEESPG